jgi:hypothetical protein
MPQWLRMKSFRSIQSSWPWRLALGLLLSAASGRADSWNSESNVPDACNPWLIDSTPEDCWTPRLGVVSGFYIAGDIGYVTMKPAAGNRVGVGPGAGGQIRLGMEMMDAWLIELGIGSYGQKDRRPFTEDVVQCQEVENVTVYCDNDVQKAKSGVDVTFGAAAIGYQVRLRPSSGLSIASGLLLGFTFPISAVERSVSCDGCQGVPLDLRTAGFSVAPMLRVTFGPWGGYALAVRSTWYFTGDLQQMSVFGFEYGLP